MWEEAANIRDRQTRVAKVTAEVLYAQLQAMKKQRDELLSALSDLLEHENYLLDMHWKSVDVADAHCRICGASAPSEHEVEHREDCPFTRAWTIVARVIIAKDGGED